MTTPLPWHHIHLTHKNRAAVAKWYATVLGAHVGEGTRRSENLWFENNLVQVQSDTGIAPPRTGEIDHIGIALPDLSRTVQAAVDGGAKLIRDSLIEDPWGTRIELVASDRTAFHHVHVVCTDATVSGHWYATNIGGDVVTCPWDSNCVAIRYDTMWLVFEQREPAGNDHGTARPIDHLGWYTADIDETAGQMLGAGCKFPVPVRAFGPVRLAFAEDPSGLWVEFVEPVGGRIPK